MKKLDEPQIGSGPAQHAAGTVDPNEKRELFFLAFRKECPLVSLNVPLRAVYEDSPEKDRLLPDHNPRKSFPAPTISRFHKIIVWDADGLGGKLSDDIRFGAQPTLLYPSDVERIKDYLLSYGVQWKNRTKWQYKAPVRIAELRLGSRRHPVDDSQIEPLAMYAIVCKWEDVTRQDLDSWGTGMKTVLEEAQEKEKSHA